MLILTIRTDKPEAELGLYEDQRQVAYEVWPAHRELAETVHIKIRDLLQQINKSQADIQGIVIYKGPGSFTGLRIGMAVANALAFSCSIPLVATEGEWLENGIMRLVSGDNDPLAVPDYGSEARITAQRK